MTRTYTGWDYIIHSVPGYPAPDYIEPPAPAAPIVPAVWTQSISAVCIDAANVALSSFTATPGGGTYTGTGIVGGSFNPSTAGAGTHTLTYTLASGQAATNTIVVNPLPTLTFDIPSLGSPLPFVAGSTIYQWRPIIDLAPTATPSGGTFSGTGMSGSSFEPAAAGLGMHTITYAYTDGNSCAATTTGVIEVITHPPTLPPPPIPEPPGFPPFIDPDPAGPGLPDFTPYYEPTLRAQEFLGVVFMAEFEEEPPEEEEGGEPPIGGGGGGGAPPGNHYSLDGLNEFGFDFVWSKVNGERYTFSISATPREIGGTYDQHLAQAIAVYDWGGTLWHKRD